MKDAPWTTRLAYIERRTPIERACAALKAEIEELGAHPLLTDALCSVDEAMRTLGLWHDHGRPGGAAQPARPAPTHRHIKSGRLYTLLMSASREADLTELSIYRGEDGQVWARPAVEFEERFEPLVTGGPRS
jgi:hypothetical protein